MATPLSSSSTSSSCIEALRAYLRPVEIVAAFSSTEGLEFAQALWQGRDGPPYFHRVKCRTQLDDAACSDSAAADFLAELLSQNWRVVLDAGLGAPEAQLEHLLVCCSPVHVQQLLMTAGFPASKPPPEGSISVVAVAGTAAGQDATWQRLEKERVCIGKLPCTTETVT